MNRSTRLPIRVYIETSVFGGPFDEEFAAASRAFFRDVDEGRFSPLEVARDEEEDL